MREILFRGKRVDNGEWGEGQTIVVIHQDDNDLIFMPQHGEDVKADPMEGNDRVLTSIYGNYYQILPQTVGQYTGLTDKNGKKIFEGDIVKTSHGGSTYYAKIEWDDGSFWVTNHDIQMPSYISEVSKTYLEIIGNIHDNPELLEVKE